MILIKPCTTSDINITLKLTIKEVESATIILIYLNGNSLELRHEAHKSNTLTYPILKSFVRATFVVLLNGLNF